MMKCRNQIIWLSNPTYILRILWLLIWNCKKIESNITDFPTQIFSIPTIEIIDSKSQPMYFCLI